MWLFTWCSWKVVWRCLLTSNTRTNVIWLDCRMCSRNTHPYNYFFISRSHQKPGKLSNFSAVWFSVDLGKTSPLQLLKGKLFFFSLTYANFYSIFSLVCLQVLFHQSSFPQTFMVYLPSSVLFKWSDHQQMTSFNNNIFPTSNPLVMLSFCIWYNVMTHALSIWVPSLCAFCTWLLVVDVIV